MENRFLCKARPVGIKKQWVLGFYAVLGEKTVIIVNEPEKFYDVDSEKNSNGNKIVEVIPETVCKHTGYNGFFEKDIFTCEDEVFVIKWSDNLLEWEAENVNDNEKIPLCDFLPEDINVIGNAIDNPKLLESEDNEG